MDFRKRLEFLTSMTEEYIDKKIPCKGEQNILFEAMRYSLCGGGKRIRPVLLLEFFSQGGNDPHMVLPFAASIEIIHTYSLIHDDLPCMDDDDMRRGRPSNHKMYGEAMALLAGDGLLNLACELTSDPSLTPGILPGPAREAAYAIFQASGMHGMIGGQVLDIVGGGKSLERLDLINSMKTGALIEGACAAGCILAGLPPEKVTSARMYAAAIGRAFQLQDDILDKYGDKELTGKGIGRDEKQNKTTYAGLLSREECADMVEKLTGFAKEQLSAFEQPEFLRWLADWLATRER